MRAGENAMRSNPGANSALKRRFDALKRRFDAAHRDGMDALKQGDYEQLGTAVALETAVFEEQKRLIEALRSQERKATTRRER